MGCLEGGIEASAFEVCCGVKTCAWGFKLLSRLRSAIEAGEVETVCGPETGAFGLMRCRGASGGKGRPVK